MVTQCAGKELHALAADSNITAGIYLSAVISLLSVVMFMGKNACLDELLETCISYFSTSGCYDWIVSAQTGACA
jgi:hypothetical protein